jgi:O-antigen/teichoic acid export membrane protein
VFAAPLSVYLVAQFVSNPLTQALNVLGRQRLFLWFDGVRALITLGAFGASWTLSLSPFVTLSLYSAGLAGYYAANAWAVLRLVRQRLPA